MVHPHVESLQDAMRELSAANIALRDRVAKLERVAQQLGDAMQLQTDYASLPCREMDAKYGRVVDLTFVADVVSTARAALDDSKD